MTTLRKLPTASPSTKQVPIRNGAEDARSSITSDMITGGPKENAAQCAALSGRAALVARAPSDHRTELEDRQVHGDHQAADQYAQHQHDEGLEQARHRVHGVVDLRFVEGGDLPGHLIERARFLAH